MAQDVMSEEASPAVEPAAKPEARAIWVVRYDMTSPESIRQVVERAKKYNFNALIVQVRGRGDAFYLGGLEPRSESLEKQPATFDPLQTAIDLCRKEGIQVHAWLNTFYVWSGAEKPKDPKHIVNTRPDWLMTDRDGVIHYTYGGNNEGAFLDPGHPDARKFVHDIFLDVATRYDVDGIHFDYVRYPNRDMGFNDADMVRFQALMDPTLDDDQKAALAAMPERDAYPRMFPAKWAQWRRDNVSALVRSIYQDVKKVKPHMAVSAALIPWGTLTAFEDSDAYNSVSQDWFGWMREGILDIAVPMTYHTDNGQWASWVRGAVENRHKTHVWAGIGDWLHTGEGDAEKVRLAREMATQGVSFFAYNSLISEGPDTGPKGAPLNKLETLQATVYAAPAPVPDYQAPQPDAKPPKVDVPKPSDVEQPRW